jgi:hypothetical protein
LLGANVLREIISFLSLTDFIEFCTTCKKFLKFWGDKYVRHQHYVKELLYKEENTEENKEENKKFMDLIEIKFMTLCRQNYFPFVNCELKPFQLNLFHFILHDSRRFVFFFHDRVFEIKETVNFSSNLRPIFSKEFNTPILMAKGYKNILVLGFYSKVELLRLSSSDIMVADEGPSDLKNFSYSYPKLENIPLGLEIVNKGKNILIAFYASLYLLTDQLNLLNIHRYKDSINKYTLLVPSKEGKSYIIYNKTEIKYFRVNSSKEVKIDTESSIEQIYATHFNGPHLVYGDCLGNIYLDKRKLDIRAVGNFIVKKKYIAFVGHTNRRTICVYNLELNKIIYQTEQSYNMDPVFIDITPYKIILISNNEIFLFSIIFPGLYKIFDLFYSLGRVEFSEPLLLITGKIEGGYGLAIQDFFRQVPMNKYLDSIHKEL